MNIKVIIYWQSGFRTVHTTHLEDLGELIVEMVLYRDEPFEKVSVLNWSFPYPEIKDEAFQE